MAILKFSKILLFFLSAVFIFPLSSFSQNNTTEEIMTFETYYPAPFGVYNEMRSKKMAIGDTYYNGSQYCWSGSCSNLISATADLVVEGKVGIGTVAVSALEPTTILKVEGNHSLGGNTVEILNRGGGDVGMGFFDANDAPRGNIAYVTSLGPLRFAINQQYSGWGGPLTNTTINEDGGSVGIGTTAATTAPDGGGYGAPKVDIRGQLFLTSNADNYIGLYLSRSGGPTSGWNSPGGTWGIYRYGSIATPPSSPERFGIGITGVNEAVSILPDGNVGIGTVNPTAKLEVAGGDDSFAWGGDHSSNGYVRIGNVQICWGNGVAVDYPGYTNWYMKATTIQFPSGCQFKDNNYSLTATPTSTSTNGKAFVGPYLISRSTTSAWVIFHKISDTAQEEPTAVGPVPFTWMAIGTWQ